MTTLQRINNAEISKKARKKKKKSQRNQKRNQKDFTLASGVNAIEFGELGKRKNKNWKYLDRNLSTIMCYNCDKKGYYINICPNPPKNWLQSRQSLY